MTRYGLSQLILGFFLTVFATTEAMAIPIGGRILDPSGTPLSNARIELVPLVAPYESEILVLEGLSHAPPFIVAWSDLAGFFHLDAPQIGMWEILVHAEGFVPVEIELLPVITPLELPEVRLAHAAPVAVRIVTVSGQPLPGARIRAEPELKPAQLDEETVRWRPSSRWTVSGPDGRAVIRRAEVENLILSAVAPGHVAAEVRWPSSEPAELRLVEGRQQLIEVRQPDGEPLSGVVASASGWPLGRTDHQGRLDLTLPPDRDETIAFEAADGRRGQKLLPRATRPADDPASALSFILKPPIRFVGQVFSQSDFRVLPGALVWPARNPAAWQRTGEDGKYTLSFSADLISTSPQWIVAAAVKHLPAADHLPLGTGATVPSLVLTPASTVSGRVLDRDGRPIVNAELNLAPIHAPPRANDTLALSDRHGRFHYRLLSPDQVYVLRVAAPGFAPHVATLAELEPFKERSDLEIILLRGQSAHGQVLDSEEQPVAGATVSLLRAIDDDAATVNIPGADALNRTETDAEGRFAVHHLATGLYELWVEAPSFAPLMLGGLAVRPDSTSVNFGKVLLEPGASVEGLVVDPQGQGISEVTVEILPASPAAQRRTMAGDFVAPKVTTVNDGWFRISDLKPDGTLTVRAQRPGYSSEVLSGVRASRSEPLRIVLTPASRVAGQILDETGVGVERGRVLLIQEGIDGEILGSAALSKGGRFVAKDVRPGRFKIMAQAPGYLGAERGGFEVAGGDKIDGIEIVVREGAIFEGRVFDPDGQGVIGARIRLSEEPQEPGAPSFNDSPQTTSETAGRYRLAGIPEGRHTLVVEHAEHADIAIDVDARGQRRLDLHLEQGWEVAGRVIDPELRPVAGTRVELVSSFGAHGAVSGGNGFFRFTAVPGGSYRLQAEKAGYARVRWPEEIRVDRADVKDLEIGLVRGSTILGRILGVDLEELADLQIVARGASGDQRGQIRITGEYRIENLASGEWNVAAYLAGTSRQARGHVTLASADDEWVLDLDLGRGLAVNGRVVRAGKPVAEAAIALQSIDGQSSSLVVSDHQGRFRAEGLTEGRYNVTVVRRGHLLQRTTLELDSDREIALELPTTRVVGRVATAVDGTPLVGARVRLEASQQQGAGSAPPFIRIGQSDHEGVFRLEGIPEGVYRLVADKVAFLPAGVPVQVTAGLDFDAGKIVLREAADEAPSP